VVVALCLYFLYQRFHKISFQEFHLLFSNSLKTHWFIFLITVLLILINWGIETIKWQYLIKSIESLSFTKAFSAVLGGVAFSSFTPNRVGEFAGRMLFLKNKMDPRIIALTIVGSMSQFLMTIIIGLPCFLVFILNFNYLGLETTPPYKIWIQFIIFTVPIFYLLIYWNLPYLFRKIKEKFKDNRTLRNLSDTILLIGFKGLFHISWLSFARYTVFTTQYMLILAFFDLDILWWQYVTFIPVIFFIQSVIPTFAITELGIRVTVALSVLHFLNLPDPQIMAASSLLWVINLMIPALVGAVALLFTKIYSNS
jgi:uncharacterized membrane protein YbhN (UPF0104 family)